MATASFSREYVLGAGRHEVVFFFSCGKSDDTPGQCATGGHTNMENFITGFPGHENEMRAAMLEVLGREKYDFFFDKVGAFAFPSLNRVMGLGKKGVT